MFSSLPVAIKYERTSPFFILEPACAVMKGKIFVQLKRGLLLPDDLINPPAMLAIVT
jgi:hypothetical protein